MVDLGLWVVGPGSRIGREGALMNVRLGIAVFKVVYLLLAASPLLKTAGLALSLQ
jgi:hypothetical protein